MEINLWDWLGRFCVCVINPFNLSDEGGARQINPVCESTLSILSIPAAQKYGQKGVTSHQMAIHASHSLYKALGAWLCEQRPLNCVLDAAPILPLGLMRVDRGLPSKINPPIRAWPVSPFEINPINLTCCFTTIKINPYPQINPPPGWFKG